VLVAVRSDPPDLVLLHHGLQFCSAILYERLRTHARTKDVPVLLVAPPEALEFFEAKPTAAFFASRPAGTESLVRRVEGVLRSLADPDAGSSPGLIMKMPARVLRTWPLIRADRGRRSLTTGSTRLPEYVG
jgi:hypothetical protein